LSTGAFKIVSHMCSLPSNLLPYQTSSASRFTAAQAGFFILSQSGERSLQ
jgi:hypothetical protein